MTDSISVPTQERPLAVDRRMALARELSGLVAEARRLDGFEDFFRPPRPETLVAAAADGPVAVINVSRWGCQALLVHGSGVDVRELPGLTLAAVVERTTGYLNALRAVDHASQELHASRQRIGKGDRALAAIRQYTDAKRSMQVAVAHRGGTLDALLRWLWDEIAEPVLDALGFADTSGERLPRLWWCPTGLLTLLPLHAAGYHGAAGRPGRSVMDRVVSSYTPTLRALVDARQPVAAQSDQDRILIVSLPDTPGEVALPNVARERDMLTSLFSSRHTLLEREEASVGAVREALPRHRWVHFSCHGGQDLMDPSRGKLLLHDGALTITEIGARQHDGEFAFLSACMTAVGGFNLPDEAVTLAAALHYAGYRQVIGTLWSVDDDTAADIAKMVYGEMTEAGRFDPSTAAYALHFALRHLRDVRCLPPSSWASFTHTGP